MTEDGANKEMGKNVRESNSSIRRKKRKTNYAIEQKRYNSSSTDWKKSTNCGTVRYSRKKILKEKQQKQNAKTFKKKIINKSGIRKTITRNIKNLCEKGDSKAVLKEPLNHKTLTQEELRMLYSKYQLDGHYRINPNLPPFTAILDNTGNQTINSWDGTTRYAYTSQFNSGSNEQDSPANFYWNVEKNPLPLMEKDWNVQRNVQPDQNFKHDSFKLNRYASCEQTSLVHPVYNNVSSNIQQSKLSTDFGQSDKQQCCGKSLQLDNAPYAMQYNGLNSDDSFQNYPSSGTSVSLLDATAYKENDLFTNKWKDDFSLIATNNNNNNHFFTRSCNNFVPQLWDNVTDMIPEQFTSTSDSSYFTNKYVDGNVCPYTSSEN